MLPALIGCIFVVITTFHEVVSDYRDVTTDQGIVRGYNDEAEDVYSFYGIPYATGPTGVDKFKAPLPPPVWDGIFNATEKLIVCHQRIYVEIEDLATTAFNCLRLNVHVPDTNETNLPVLVYIHGGAWQHGYSDDMNSISLIQKGLVIVQINYRVSLLGFLCLGTEFAPGNAGLKDQVEALKWVKRNIARFGGDPDNISLNGNSAGGSNTELHMLSPQTAGLFAKVILESGSALIPEVVASEPLKIAENYANQHYGVYTNQNVSLLEAFYRSLTEEQMSVRYNSDFDDVGFCPCLETHNIDGVEKFISENPIDIIQRGDYEKVPLLTGFSAYEGLLFRTAYDKDKPLMESNLTAFIPISLKIESEEHALEVTEKIRNLYFPDGEVTYQRYIIYRGDVTFAYPQYLSARLHAVNFPDIYLYNFIFNGTINLLDVRNSPFKGPGHIAQSLYIWDYNVNSSVYDHVTESDNLTRERLRAMWYNFCKYGDLNLMLHSHFHSTPVTSRTELLDFEWLPVTSDTTYYAILDEEFSLDVYPLRERFEMWDEVYGYNVSTTVDPFFLCFYIFFTIFVLFFIV